MAHILMRIMTGNLTHFVAINADTLWRLLPTLTAGLRALTALISLTIAAHRALRYWRARRR